MKLIDSPLNISGWGPKPPRWLAKAAEHGEAMTGAAVRLGMTPTALYQALHQYAPDTCALLQAAEKRVAA